MDNEAVKLYKIFPFAEVVSITNAKYSTGKQEMDIKARLVIVTESDDGGTLKFDMQRQDGATVKQISFPPHWLDSAEVIGDKAVIQWSGGDAGSMQNWKLEIILDS